MGVTPSECPPIRSAGPAGGHKATRPGDEHLAGPGFQRRFSTVSVAEARLPCCGLGSASEWTGVMTMRLPALVAGLVVAAAVMVAQLAQPALAGSWLQQGVALPPGATSVLNGVACTSPDRCMAVGSFHDSGGTHLLAKSRSGSAWLTVTIPDPGDAQLNAISCTSATACTAVGSSGTGTFAERWDGNQWTTQATQNPPVLGERFS